MSEPTTERLPLFPLETVLFPGMLLPLHVFEERYRRLMDERGDSDPIFGVVLTRHGREVGDRPAIHTIGTAASAAAVGRYPDGRYDLVVRGGRRFRIEAEDWSSDYLIGSVVWLDQRIDDMPELAPPEALVVQVLSAYRSFLVAFREATGLEVALAEPGGEPSALAFDICARVPLNTWERQRLLEAETTSERLSRLLSTLRRERGLLRHTGAGGATIDRPGSGFVAN